MPTTLPMPSSTPCAWLAGVDEVFVKWMRFVAASNRTRSVKVPPTSTPSRTLMGAKSGTCGSRSDAYDPACTDAAFEPDAGLARAMLANWEALGAAIAARFGGDVVDDAHGLPVPERPALGVPERRAAHARRSPTRCSSVRAAEHAGVVPATACRGAGSSGPAIAPRRTWRIGWRPTGFERALAGDAGDDDRPRRLRRRGWTPGGGRVTEVLDADGPRGVAERPARQPRTSTTRRSTRGGAAHGEFGLGPDEPRCAISWAGWTTGRSPARRCSSTSAAGRPGSTTSTSCPRRAAGASARPSRPRPSARRRERATRWASSARRPLGTPVYLRLGFRIVGARHDLRRRSCGALEAQRGCRSA